VRQATWSPPGPVAERFFDSAAFVCGILGPVGSGKSTTAIVKGMTISARQPTDSQGRRRSRAAIIRNTYPELRTTTMKSWHEWVPQDCGRWQPEGPPTHYVTGPDGLDAEIMFLALDRPDDVRKLLSLELTWAWINEAREVPKAVLDGLTARVGRFPPVRDGGCVGPQILLDTNAPDNDSWYYRLAEEAHPEGFEFFRQPGGRSPGAENVANLPPGYYARAVAGKAQDWVRVYIDAEYGYVRDGKPVYPEFIDSTHVREFELAPRAPIRIGLDFGLTPAAVVAARDALGRWRIRSEVVTEDMGAVRFAELLGAHVRERYGDRQIEAITGDPAGDQRAATDESTVYDVLRARGVHAVPAPTNDWTIRRDAFGTLLGRLIDGEPAMLVHPDCRVLRKALAGGYCLRRLQVVGMDRYRDAPDKNEFSHVAEAAQYLVLGGGEGRAVVRATREVRLPHVAESDYAIFGG